MVFLDGLKRVAAYLYDPAGNSLIGATGGVKVEGVSSGVAQPVSFGTGVPTVITEEDASKAVQTAGYAWTGVAWVKVRAGNPADAASQLTSLWTHAVAELYNGASQDRARSIAASGAGLGVARVGTMGELVTLAASAARTATASTNGTAVTGLGWRRRYLLQLDVTAAATDVDDTLDAFVDVSVDGTNYMNVAHITQVLGNGGAKRFFAVLDSANPGTAVIDASDDAAVGVVRPSMFGTSMRARWTIIDPGAGAASFTFSLVAWAI